MQKRKYLLTLISCLALVLLWVCYARNSSAEEKATYVGTDKCKTCHAKVAKNWAMTNHRRTLFNSDPAKNGCESCHGPGSAHVEAGGDPTKIINPDKVKPEVAASICLKCHTQEATTMWRTSMHAKAKISCTNCHDSHNPDAHTLSKDIDNGKLQLEGLSRSIKQAEMEANIAKAGSQEKAKADEQLETLRKERDKLLDDLKGTETAYKRVAEPYVCYNCHKAEQMQTKMVSHHPIPEGKMKCSDCHNPHGGTTGMLKGESVNETCFKCHAEKVGPFTYEHPPVTEDCTICHNPHGSTQNNLLTQSEPFLCMKCHLAPHSRSNTLGNAKSFSQYYAKCTSCHNQVHGSDQHSAFHY